MNAPQGIAALGTPQPQPQPGMAQPTMGAQPQKTDPTAQQQGGVAPPWMVLAMKAQAAKLQAAQNQIAMMQKPQPTVAQQYGMEEAAPGPQDIAMSAQGGVIQRGGVDRLPSNLRMAGGGIVGFSSGGKTDAEGMLVDENGVREGDVAGEASRLLKAIGSGILSWRDKEQAKTRLRDLGLAPREPSQNQRGDNLYVPETEQPPAAQNQRGDNLYVPATPAGEATAKKPPIGGSGRQGISAIRTATAAPSSPALKNRLEELADEIKAAHAAGNPEKAYALSQERSKLMDGGDDYMTAMKTIMGKQEALAKGEDRGILDKLIPLLRGGATSAPGAHWSQVLSSGAVGSIDHEAKLKAEQKKAQEELLKMQGQHAGTQYGITSGRHTAGIGAEDKANAAKRQQLGDRVQIEGALENSNMAKAKLAQDAAQHKETLAAKWSEIQERAKDRGDSKLQAHATAIENNIRNAATTRAAAEAKAAGVAFDPIDVQARAAIIMAQEMQNSVQLKALMQKLGMPLPAATSAGGTGIDLSKWGQPKAK